jgi:hypothetical protein
MKKNFKLILTSSLILLCIAQWLVVLINYDSMSESIPVHFNFLGNPTRFGPKILIFLILLIPSLATSLCIYLGNNPEKMNYPFPIKPEHQGNAFIKASISIFVFNFIFLVFFFLVLIKTINISVGQDSSQLNFLPYLVIALILVPFIIVLLGRNSNNFSS